MDVLPFDLTPTTHPLPINMELEQIISEYKEFIQMPTINQNKWLEILNKTDKITSTTKVRTPIKGNPDLASYSWEDDSGFIKIKIKISGEQPFEITTHSITSPGLSGELWDEVEIIDVQRMESYTHVVIKPKKDFPVLIKYGDNIDPLSSYYLALLSTILKEPDFFVKWATKSAIEGCHYAQYVLGRNLLTADQPNIAVYWLAKTCLTELDETCLVGLGSLLSKKIVKYPHYSFAENVLIDAVRQGDVNAALDLGLLYINGGGEVKVDANKGLELMRMNASHSNIDKEASKLLAKAKKEVNKTSAIDVILSAGFVGLAAGGLYYSYKKFFKK